MTSGITNPNDDVVLYTLPYCPDCRDLRNFLNARHVPFKEVDLANSPGAVVDMLKLNGGRRSAPTVRIGQQVFVDPEHAHLEKALRQHQRQHQPPQWAVR